MTFSPRAWKWTPRAKVFAIIAAAVFVVDQWTKFWAVGRLTQAFHSPAGTLGFAGQVARFWHHKHPTRDGAVTVLDDFWHFRYVENPGAAWGFLARSADWFRTPFFLIVSVVAMYFIVSYFRKSETWQRVLRVALALVFGGAVGNFFDRIRLGYVIDFIDWHWYDRATWPTFNIGDSAISVGVGLLIVDMLLQKQRAREGKRASGPT
jgi:signal peptidase II